MGAGPFVNNVVGMGVHSSFCGLCSCVLMQRSLIPILILILILIVGPDPQIPIPDPVLPGSARLGRPPLPGAMQPFLQGPWVRMNAPCSGRGNGLAVCARSLQGSMAWHGMRPMSWSSQGVDAESYRYMKMLVRRRWWPLRT